ncbi:MAG TPA: hypothetical protein VFM05_09960 [Candidatus Saccharimonadales bacterium]|nr:hypothetical protein [Candidatus Saccharimonadales bacterium]
MARFTPLTQRGSGHLVAILAVLVVVAAGFVGYQVVTNEEQGSKYTQKQTQTVPDTLKTTKDIDQASASLDTYDNDLDPDQLDEDLNSIL